MYLRHLQVGQFRSWESADLALTPGATVLVGRNGQGKTNLVEAVGYLATLGSHRVSSDAPLVRHGAAQAVVRAALRRDERELLVEVEINPGRANRVRVNRAPLPRPRFAAGCLAFAPATVSWTSCTGRSPPTFPLVLPALRRPSALAALHIVGHHAHPPCRPPLDLTNRVGGTACRGRG